MTPSAVLKASGKPSLGVSEEPGKGVDSDLDRYSVDMKSLNIKVD